MKQLLNKLHINKEICSYIICGVLTTFIDWVSYLILRQVNCSIITSNIISWILAIIFAYGSNKVLVFKTYTISSFKSLLKEFSNFVLGRVGTGILQISGIYLLVNIFQLNEYVSKLFISVIVLILNYLISKFIVFNEKTNFDYSYIIAFGIPIFLMLILFIIVKIYPFGDNFFVKSDGFHQYIPFLKEFSRRIHNKESLFYSFNLNLGTNFLTLYAYYLASPFNWLCAIVPIEYITEFAGYMMLFKVGLSSLFFYIYLKNKNELKAENNIVNNMNILLSFCYAFSGYWAAYSWNIMWLDCVVFLPLVLLGIYKLVKENKIKLYIFSLFFCIISNYYIAIMICIFSMVYFLYELILQNNEFIFKKLIKPVLLFIYSSLIAGGLCGVLLVPEFYGLLLSASQDIKYPETFRQYFSMLELIPRHLMNLSLSMTGDYPNVYSGLIVLLLVPIYFISSKVSLKEKICDFTLIIFLLLGFCFNTLDFVWHGFHFPNSLPCRQSFIYIAIILLISSKVTNFILEIKNNILCRIYIIIFFILLYFDMNQQILGKSLEKEIWDFKDIWISILFLSIYLICFLILNIKKEKTQVVTYISFVLSVCLCMELAINMLITSLNTWQRSDYLKADTAYSYLLSNIEEEKDTTYRVEKRMDDYRTKNDGAWYNYNSISTFSSSSNKKPSEFYKLMGLESSWNASNFRGSTPFISALLNVRYELSNTNTGKEDEVSKLINKKDNYYLYENLYTFPLGFEINKNNKIEFNNLYPTNNQNKLSRLFVNKDILDMYIDESNTFNFDFNITESGRYFAYITDNTVKKVVYSHNNTNKTFENIDRGYLVDLGYIEANEKITLTEENSPQNVNCILYKFNVDTLKEIYNHINPLKITTFEDTYIKGNIKMLQDNTLFLSIPYDEGWHIYVDGEKVNSKEIFNTFIGINLSKGEHAIELKYIPQGLYLGISITLISISILIFSWLFCFFKTNKGKHVIITINSEC